MPNETFDSDVRYGSSFLNIDRNRQSVPGEIMTDKLSGEVYLKRPGDGKIVSFKQKAHTLYEAIQEFNIQFQSSLEFTYPENPGSYLLGVKVDVDEYLPSNKKKDILLENHEFTSVVGEYTTIRFELSTETNGFYLKPITRYGDRNICGYLSGQYSEHENTDFSSPIRSFEDWLDLSTLYDTPYKYTEWQKLENWKSTNALMDCTITVTGADEDGVGVENVVKVTAPLQINEHTHVRFPEEYNADMEYIYNIVVTIDKIYAPKLQYERYLSEDSSSSSGLNPTVTKLMELDNRVVLQSLDIFYFISGGSQLPTNPNTTICQCVDVEFLDQAIIYLSTSSGSRAIQSQVEEPEAFPVDTMWAEELREIDGNKVTETNSVNKFEDLEKSLYSDSDDSVTFTDEINNDENILIIDRNEI